MKKFFGILLAVVTTLVLLPCCGGGGDDSESTVMTPNDYMNAKKHFVLGAGTNGTLYYAPSKGGDVISDTRDENNANGSVLIGGELGGVAQVSVRDNPGRDYTVSVNNYECFYDENGKLTKAVLSFSYDAVITGEDEATQAFWNIAVAEGEVAQGLQIEMELNFETMTWSMLEREDGEDDGEGADPAGGLFTVKSGTNFGLDYRK